MHGRAGQARQDPRGVLLRRSSHLKLGVISLEAITSISSQGNQGSAGRPRIQAAKSSLRLALLVIPSAILCLAILIAIGVTLLDARGRIVTETASGLNLGDLVLSHALHDLTRDPDPEAALIKLRRDLSRLRHISLRFVSDPALGGNEHEGDAPSGGKNQDTPGPADTPLVPWPEPSRRATRAAPLWFEAMFEPARIVKTYPVVLSLAGDTEKIRGSFVMATRPGDEVAEVWRDLVFLTGLLGCLSLIIVGLIALCTHQALRLFHQLVEGLDRLGRGQFAAMTEFPVQELAQIGMHFNQLAATLERSEVDKHHLIDRLISVQESERKELARELHDEYGAALFGIRAATSCILDSAHALQRPEPGENQNIQEISERAQAISQLADTIQKQNRRILERIRPAVLHRMGLPEALRHLVEDWQTHHKGFSCALTLAVDSASFDEEVSLTFYRLVQECLTNIARHSQARSARITLALVAASAHPEEGVSEPGQNLCLRIEDDGIGLPPSFRFGFGFLGMSERVRKLAGCLRIENALPHGTLIEALIPLPRSSYAKSHPWYEASNP